MATPEMAQQLIQYSTMYPYGSAELGLALAQGGIPSGSPMANDLAMQELQTRNVLGPVEKPGGGIWDGITGVLDEWVVNPVQGATRWGFAAWDAAYNMIAGGAPIRAKQLSREEGITFGEAWQEQDPYFFEALGGLFTAGERVNLGSGWLPQSDVAPGVEESVQQQMMTLEAETAGLPANERYRTRLEAAPGVWTQAVTDNAQAQAALGKPLTQFHDVQAESVMFEVNDIYGNQRYTPWSPGRIIAANIVEPGTEPFKWVSGAGDFASQIFADPVEWVGLGWAKAGRNGRRIWAEGTKIADEVQKAPQAPLALGTAADSDVPGVAVEAAQRVQGSFATPSVDPTRQAALEMGIGVYPDTGGVPVAAFEPTTRWVGEGARRQPWWFSGDDTRVPTWQDVPAWFVDRIKQEINSTRGRYAQGTWEATARGRRPNYFRRKLAGVYEYDLPRMAGSTQQNLLIARRGKGKGQYWDITLPDGSKLKRMNPDNRFDGGMSRFRTLEEAKTAARKYAYGDGLDELKYKNMTVEEFMDSGEELVVDDIDYIIRTTQEGRKKERIGHVTRQRRGSRSKKARREAMTDAERKAAERVEKAYSNARVMVYGKTLDLSSGSAANLPERLKAALRADGKLRGDRIIGMGDPNLEAFDNTLKYMEDNGFGKLKWDDETTIFHDEFIGNSGMSADPMSRFSNPADEPIQRIALEDELITSPTTTEINEVAEFVANSGRRYSPQEVVMPDAPRAAGVAGPPTPDELVREGRIVGDTRRGGDIDPDFAIDVTDPQVAGRAEYNRNMADRIVEVANSDAPSPAIKSGRNQVDPNFTLHGKKSSILVDKIASLTRAGGKTDTRDLDRLLRFFKRQGSAVPTSVRTALFEAPDASAVRRILAEWMVNDGVTEAILPGGFQFGRAAWATGYAATNMPRPQVSIIDDHWFKRRLAKSFNQKNLNIVNDPSRVYDTVLDSLPHYNIERGAELARYNVQTGELMEGKIKVEDVLEKLRLLEPNQKEEALQVMAELQGMMFSSLVGPGSGIDPRLAEFASRWYAKNAEMTAWLSEHAGRADLSNGAYEASILGEELLFGLGPNSTADLWKGELMIPAQRDVRRIVNESDALGRIANRLTSKLPKETQDAVVNSMKFEDRVWFHYATVAMNRIWKPFVLLRAAWTLRILFDDQARMLADGRGALNRPGRLLSYALMHPNEARKAMTTGKMDIFGNTINLNKLTDEIPHVRYMKEAAMRQPDPKVGIGAAGIKGQELVPKGNPRYYDAIPWEVARMQSSPTMIWLADANEEEAVAKTVAILMGKDKRLAQQAATERLNLSALHKRTPEIADKIIMGDEDILTAVVQRQYALLNRITGGDVVLRHPDGSAMQFDLQRVEPGAFDPTDKADWVVRERGDQELLDIIAGRGDIDTLTDEGMQSLKALTKKKIDAAPDRFPGTARAPKSIEETGQTQSALDEVVGTFYQWAMTLPSNRLSRSPVFADAYWQRMTGFYPYASPELRKAIEAKAPLKYKQQLKKADAKKADEGAMYITDFDQADEHAKAFAMTEVERTLFDLTAQRNINQSLNLIFPFIEAWEEFLTRWGRMMVTGDRNIANARRFQQTVEGARDSGFFYENEYGQEVFNYPSFLTKFGVGLHNTLNNVIPGMGADVSAEVANNIQATGSVESLNFASGVIPGFGPMAQMAAKQWLPDDPKFDWAREIVAPFGTSGGVVSQFAPAWVKRIWSANGGFDDPALMYTYNSTVMDVLRTKADRGDFEGVTSVEEINRLVEEAEEEAKGVLMVRAAATFVNPASPSYRFQKEDVNGMWWSYSNLGEAFREMQEEAGEGAAFDMFIERFGFLPHAFRGGKGYFTQDRSVLKEGYKFERANPELFDAYPGTAMYYDPNIGTESEYSHEAMLYQLDQGLRQQYTAEQWVYLQQDQLGDLWWDNAQSVAAGMTKARGDEYLMGTREMIEEKYPFWNQPVPGRVQSITNEQQMEEVQRAMRDPRVNNAPSLQAAMEYEAYRQEVLASLTQFGATTIDGPKSRTTDAGKLATYGRERLRQLADELIMQVPEFGPLYRSVYASEVAEYNDEALPPSFDMFNEGDIFFDLGLSA